MPVLKGTIIKGGCCGRLPSGAVAVRELSHLDYTEPIIQSPIITLCVAAVCSVLRSYVTAGLQSYGWVLPFESRKKLLHTVGKDSACRALFSASSVPQEVHNLLKRRTQWTSLNSQWLSYETVSFWSREKLARHENQSMIDWRKELFFGNSQGVRNPFAICSRLPTSNFSVQQSDEHNGARWLLWNDSTITSDHSKASQTDDHTFRMNHSKFELNHLKNWNHSAIQIVETIQIIRTFLQFEHLIRCYSILVDGESMLLELYNSLGSRRGSHFLENKKKTLKNRSVI